MDNLKGKKLVWVEDDQFLSGIIASKLTSHGIALLHASTGDDGFAMIKKERPDIVLLDLLLPGISGFDVLQKVKEDAELKNIPVIVFSNLGEPKEIKKARDLGAKKFLVKAAIVPDQIIDELNSAL